MRWTAYAAAAGPLLVPSRAGAVGRGAAAAAGDVTPINLELVTLTEDAATLTWYTGATGSVDALGRMEPAPADAAVMWGTDPKKLDRTASSDRTDTPYHLVHLTGLEPGRTYWYQATSGGKAATPTKFSMVPGNAVSTEAGDATGTGPFSFTVPQPPPGRFLFSVVLCNDLHVGETVAGHSGNIPALQGVSQLPGHDPYPEVMFESLVHDANQLGAHYLLAAGDITAEAEPIDLATARRMLDQFGDRHADWWVARGNHDREHDGPAWASCSIGAFGGHDCFVDQFFPDAEPTYFADDLLGLRVLGLDTYQTSGKGSEAGVLGADQMDWIRETLATDPDQPTMVFGHHPLVVEGSPYPTPPSSSLDAKEVATLVERYRATPGVFLHHAGHTHRNHQSTLAGAPGVVHQEVAAVKEYPGGFTLLRIHEGGYALNFHKSSSDEARAWNERSRTQVGGSWPQFALGSRVSDRNTVVERDLSGLRPATAKTKATTTTVAGSASGGSTDGDEDGSNLLVRGAGVAVLAAAGLGGAVAWRRRTERTPDAESTGPAGGETPAD